MYPVSAAFLAAVKSNNRRYYWTGQLTTKYGATHDFDQDDIVKGSGYISAQCCGSTELELGNVYAAELGISLFRNFERYTLEGGIIIMTYHLRISTSLDPAEVDPDYAQTLEDDGIYEALPMGVYEINEANRKTKSVEIRAYDYMLRFEKPFQSNGSVGKPFDFVNMCATACRVELEQTRSWYEALPNGEYPLSLYTDNDIESYRDVLYYIAQVLGGYFVINRAGKLELRKYGTNPVLMVEQRHRFTSSFSDFVTKYTAVSSSNLRTQQSEYYHLDPDDGLTMNLGVNPFLQFGVQETREQLCTNILNDIAVINYVPFESDTIGNPALDLGDILQFSGGQADNTKISAVTLNSIKIGGKQTIKCVGKNPALASAKSKNDKNISGLLNSIEQGRISIYTYTNAEAYNVSTMDQRIIAIEFATHEANNAQFFGQVIVDVTAASVSKSATAAGEVTIPAVEVDDIPEGGADPQQIGNTVEQTLSVSIPVTWIEDGHADVIFTFELNDVMIETHMPQENWHSGRHTILLYYPIENVIADYTNRFNVYMRVSGGSAVVATGNIIASISGQSMGAAAAWDGDLEFEEKYTRFRFGRGTAGQIRMKTMADSIVVKDDYIIEKKTFTDVFTGRHAIAVFARPIDVPGSNVPSTGLYLGTEYLGDDIYAADRRA